MDYHEADEAPDEEHVEIFYELKNYLLVVLESGHAIRCRFLYLYLLKWFHFTLCDLSQSLQTFHFKFKDAGFKAGRVDFPLSKGGCGIGMAGLQTIQIGAGLNEVIRMNR